MPKPSGSAWTTDSTLIRAGARRTFSSMAFLPRASSVPSSTRSWTKWATTPSLALGGDDHQPLGAGVGGFRGHQLDAGSVDDRQQPWGTVFVAGRKRVPQTRGRHDRRSGMGTCGLVIASA